MTINAVIYCRISRDRTGAGLGVERQEEDCRALAQRLGWDVARVFVDNDISAYSGRTRPAYAEMLELLGRGGADGVICWHTDRLHRSPKELEEYIRVTEAHDVVTHSVKAGKIDLSTPSGRAVARTLGAWARYESEHKSERVTRAMLQATTAGKFTGGPVPFGWRIVDGTPVLDLAEAAEVAKATRAVLAGSSMGSIIRDMGARGITTRRGNPFDYAGLRRMLLRARNAGLADWHGKVVGESTFPAIVTEEEWRAVTRLLSDPARRYSQSSRVKHLLAGIALCGACGGPVKSATMSTGKGYKRTVYRCKTPKAGHPVRNAAPIEEYVGEVVVGILSRPDAADLFAPRDGPDMSVLRSEAMALRERLDGAAEQYAEGNISGPQLARITTVIEEKLARVESTMSAARPAGVLGELDLGRGGRAVWDGASVETRRRLVDALLVVTILPTERRHGREFDPATVRIESKVNGPQG